MNVVLYSTNCPKCKVLKQTLDKELIQYTENNSVDEMIKLGIVQVPMLSVDGDLMDYSKAVQWVNKQRGLNDEKQ